MVKFVGSGNNFVRDNRCHFFAASLHARQGEVQAPPLLDHWLVAKLRRYALPSAFAFAVRAARDALPERHGLSRRPVAHPAKSPTSAQFLTPERCFVLYLMRLLAV
ncbi:hypothetical protein EF878_01450 [Dickeya undicola]|uniref:Uncharacterized protein n=1 Tax=Dickeya undicola TaxID=1577887 RepID=A0A3N0GAV7_9GAMM|nr:hypothetical protein EF878_01450 [Dickeya undicola]